VWAAVPDFPDLEINVSVHYPAPYREGMGDIPVQASVGGESFGIWFSWDDESLFFACRVQDPEHRQTRAGFDLWQEDSIQLAIDPLRDGLRGASFRPDDSEYLFALTPQGPVAWRTASMEGRPVGRVETGSIEIVHGAGLTEYRAALPWKDISPYQPSEGQILGVSVLVNDLRDGKRVTEAWGGGIDDRKEPYWYASIRLVR
jgi:hypothetical protein